MTNKIKEAFGKKPGVARLRTPKVKKASITRGALNALKAGFAHGIMNNPRTEKIMKRYTQPTKRLSRSGRRLDPASLMSDRYGKDNKKLSGKPLPRGSVGPNSDNQAKFPFMSKVKSFFTRKPKDNSLPQRTVGSRRAALDQAETNRAAQALSEPEPKSQGFVSDLVRQNKEKSTKKKRQGSNPKPKDDDLDITGSVGDSTEIVRNARIALAEACWKGYKAKGLKKKGNRMVPNCVKEGTLDDLPTQMKNAARKAKAKGEDQVDAVEKVRKDFEAKADDKHYGKKEESDDPRMKTTPASIQQAGGDPKVYKQEKAKKDPQPTTKQSKKSSRRATVGRGGGKYRRERIQPPKGHEGPSAPTRQVSAAGDAKGDQKKNFQKGGKERPMSKKQVNRMGVRGQEKKIAAKKKGKTGAANIQLMRDMGVLKTDSRGRVTLAKKKR